MLLHLCVPSLFIAAFTGYFQGQHEANAKAICVWRRGPRLQASPHCEHTTAAAAEIKLLGVRTFVFLMFNVMHTWASEATSSSNKIPGLQMLSPQSSIGHKPQRLGG